jgi:uncharacterized membrane protein
LRKIVLFLIFIGFLFAKNVLILNSYSINLSWTKSELEGILEKLNNRSDLKIYTEFMDTKVFRPTPKRLNDFLEYLKHKYKNIHFDIVITTDDNALNFVRENKNIPQFVNAKVFFAGVNNLALAKELDKNIYAGVFEKKEPLVNLKFIKSIDPEVSMVYVVADNSNSAKSVMKEYKNAYKNIKNINFEYINEKNLEKVLEKVKNYNSHTAMMLLTPFSFNLQGGHLNYKYAIMLISEYFKRPIVIHTDLLSDIPKTNIVGGKVTDGLTQGREVAKKVIEYLSGKDMKDIGFIFEKANKMYLNVKNLEKFGVNAYSLNFDNAVYVNKPDTFYEMYREWIISFAILFFIIIVIMVILFMKNRQLKKYNVKIKNMNKTLEDKINKAIEEIKKRDLEIENYKEEAYRKIIDAIVFQLKYPIKKLDENINDEKLKELSGYLSEKIDEFENLFVKKEEKEFSIKEVIKYILSISAPILEAYNITVNIKGDDFKIKANKAQFEQMLMNILKSIKDFSELDKIKIEIELNAKEKTIYIKEINNSLNKDIFDKILNPLAKIENESALGLYFSKIVLEDSFNGAISLKNDKNHIFFEIKLI